MAVDLLVTDKSWVQMTVLEYGRSLAIDSHMSSLS